jgi:hypothetical protein
MLRREIILFMVQRGLGWKLILIDTIKIYLYLFLNYHMFILPISESNTFSNYFNLGLNFKPLPSSFEKDMLDSYNLYIQDIQDMYLSLV